MEMRIYLFLFPVVSLHRHHPPEGILERCGSTLSGREVDRMKIEDFQKTMLWSFFRESILLGEKFYGVEELEGYYRELGVDFGILADEHYKKESRSKGSLGSEGFFLAVKEWLDQLGLVSHLDSIENKTGLIHYASLSLGSLFKDIHNSELFIAGLIGGMGAKNFGYCSVAFAQKGKDVEVEVLISLEEMEMKPDTAFYEFRSEEFMERELHFYDSFSKKMKTLLDRSKSLETKNRELENRISTSRGKGADLTLFKRNQELEKSSLELRSQNAELGKKNAELAFQVIEVEEDVAAKSIKIAEREKLYADLQQEIEMERKRWSTRETELSSELRETQDFLSKSQEELQNKMHGLQIRTEELNALMLQKDELDKELTLAKLEQEQLKKQIDDIEMTVLERDEALKTLEDRYTELEKVNEQLQEEYIKRIQELAKVDFGISKTHYGVVGAPKEVHPFDLLCTVFIPFMGPSGRLFVEKAYQKSNIAHGSTVDSEVRKVCESLIQAAKKVVGASSPDFQSIKEKITSIMEGTYTLEVPQAEQVPAETPSPAVLPPVEPAVSPEKSVVMPENGENESFDDEGHITVLEKADSPIDQEQLRFVRELIDDKERDEALEAAESPMKDEPQAEPVSIPEQEEVEDRDEADWVEVDEEETSAGEDVSREPLTPETSTLSEAESHPEAEISPEGEAPVEAAVSPKGAAPAGAAVSPEGVPPAGAEISPEGAAPAGAAVSPEGAAPAGAAVSPEGVPPPLPSIDGEVEEEEVDENWLIEEIEKGNDYLKKKEFEKSMELFYSLFSKVPTNQDVLKGLFHSYCGFNCWIEAYDVSKKIDKAGMAKEDLRIYLMAMQEVLHNRLNQVRNREQQKTYMLELAEIFIFYQNKKQRAREILRDALKIPEVTPNDEKILYYYSQLLIEEGKKETLEYLLQYIEQFGERVTVYDLLMQYFKKDPASPKMPVINRISAFLNNSMEEVKEKYQEDADDDIYPEINLALSTFKMVEEGRENWITNFFIEKVFPILNLEEKRIPKQITNIMKQTKGAVLDDPLEQEILSFNEKIFKIEHLEILRYSGYQPFFATLQEVDGPTFILNETTIAKLSPLEMRFVILHELVHHYRNHNKIWSIAETLSIEDKLKFIPLIKELFAKTHTTIPTVMEAKLDELTEDHEKAMMELDETLKNLQSSVESVQLLNVFEFLRSSRPFKSVFDSVGDRFALLGVRNLREATFAIVKEEVSEEWVLEEIRKKGLKMTFEGDNGFTSLRRRIQDLWLFTLRHYPGKR